MTRACFSNAVGIVDPDIISDSQMTQLLRSTMIVITPITADLTIPEVTVGAQLKARQRKIGFKLNLRKLLTYVVLQPREMLMVMNGL